MVVDLEKIKANLAYATGDVNNLSILIEIEDIIEKAGLYVYKNWDIGELVKGPEVSRHWVKVTFMYPLKKMPDPDGIGRLEKFKIKVKYKKSEFRKPVNVVSLEDIEDPVTKKAKTNRHKVWLVELKVPKYLIDARIALKVDDTKLDDFGIEKNDFYEE